MAPINQTAVEYINNPLYKVRGGLIKMHFATPHLVGNKTQDWKTDKSLQPFFLPISEAQSLSQARRHLENLHFEPVQEFE